MIFLKINPQKRREFDAIGVYLAHLRHELMVENWVSIAKYGTNFLDTEEINSEKVTRDNITIIRNDVANLSKVTELDNLVFLVANGASIERLIGGIQNILNEFEKDIWENWSDYIINLLQDMLTAPKSIIDTYVREGIHYVYNQQFERLSQRLGLAEFAKVIGWDKKKTASYKNKGLLPEPVQILGSTPLWTIGQAEKFVRVIINKETNKSALRGSWHSMYVPEFDEVKIYLELMDDVEAKNGEPVFRINNNLHSYYFEGIYLLTMAGTEEEMDEIAYFLLKRTDFAPDVYSTWGQGLTRLGLLKGAKEKLEKSIVQYEEIFPKELKGSLCCDVFDGYPYTLVYLAYIYSMEGKVEKAIEQLKKAQRRTHGNDFHQEIKLLETSNVQFNRWFFNGYLNWQNTLLDRGKRGELIYNLDYVRSCKFEVPMDTRKEIKKEYSLFQTLVCVSVSLKTEAIKDNPNRIFKELNRYEGGILFNQTCVIFQNDGAIIDDDIIPLENQNLIYPLIISDTINKISEKFTQSTKETTQEKLIEAGESVLGDDLFQKYQEEICDESISVLWRGFFRD